MEIFTEAVSIAPTTVWDGVDVRYLHGDRQTLAIAELEPDCVVPRHQHENEQLGVVLQGSITFDSDGVSRTLNIGDMYRFLANVPHGARVGPDGAVVVECFTPTRSDWDALPAADTAAFSWPIHS
jgi:quercetin dioxygenase-like cupin family protein